MSDTELFKGMKETPAKEEVTQTIEQKYHAILAKSAHNGCGKFQQISGVIVMLCLIGYGYIEYGLGYLELMPKFTCTIDGVEQACKAD